VLRGSFFLTLPEKFSTQNPVKPGTNRKFVQTLFCDLVFHWTGILIIFRKF
jgi:hypothetical protein